MTEQDKTPESGPASQAGATSASDDWADALAEQTRSAPATSQADGLKGAQGGQDDWAAAMAEQQTSASTAPAVAPAPAVFQPLANSGSTVGNDIDMIMDVPVQLTVELGRTRLTIKNLLQLGQGSVVELDGLAGEPMDIFVNGYLIAQGEVVVVEDRYGIRLTDIITPSERINRLNGRR